jgi:hypothetical protein
MELFQSLGWGWHRRTRICIALALGLFIFTTTGVGQHRPCTEEDGKRALDEADSLRTWDALYKSYRTYRNCDDGAIWEGYSESVVRILADHWNTLPRLATLGRHDTEFQRFVVKHVDATLNADDVVKVTRKARTACPPGLSLLCSDLAKQAESAWKEAN